jgi:hypothetical protein
LSDILISDVWQYDIRWDRTVSQHAGIITTEQNGALAGRA